MAAVYVHLRRRRNNIRRNRILRDYDNPLDYLDDHDIDPEIQIIQTADTRHMHVQNVWNWATEANKKIEGFSSIHSDNGGITICCNRQFSSCLWRYSQYFPIECFENYKGCNSVPSVRLQAVRRNADKSSWTSRYYARFLQYCQLSKCHWGY